MRYTVVRYPRYWVVVDLQDNNKIIFESKSREHAHAYARAANEAKSTDNS